MMATTEDGSIQHSWKHQCNGFSGFSLRRTYTSMRTKRKVWANDKSPYKQASRTGFTYIRYGMVRCDVVWLFFLIQNEQSMWNLLLAVNRIQIWIYAMPCHARPSRHFFCTKRHRVDAKGMYGAEKQRRRRKRCKRKRKQLIINRKTPFPFPQDSSLLSLGLSSSWVGDDKGVSNLRRCGMLVF